jgi:hypothetical protein
MVAVWDGWRMTQEDDTELPDKRLIRDLTTPFNLQGDMTTVYPGFIKPVS